MAFNNKTSSKARTPSRGGPRPVARKRTSKSVFQRCRERSPSKCSTKTEFRRLLKTYRHGFHYINGNEVEQPFQRSQQQVAELCGLLGVAR